MGSIPIAAFMKCSHCHQKFDDPGGLATHEKYCDQNKKSKQLYCKYNCGSAFDSSMGLENHEQSCPQNPGSHYKEFQVKCAHRECNKKFTVKEIKNNFPEKNRYFCSKRCARSFASLYGRERVTSTSTSNRSNGPNKYPTQPKRVTVCKTCGDNFTYRYENKSFCSRKCYQNSNDIGAKGGYGGGGHSGFYKGDYYHSSWELAFAVYHYDHHIPFKRISSEKFEYQWNGEKLFYIPDFKYHDEHYIEIKGWLNDKDKAKINDFPHQLSLVTDEDIRKYLDYVKNKHGKQFFRKLYN